MQNWKDKFVKILDGHTTFCYVTMAVWRKRSRFLITSAGNTGCCNQKGLAKDLKGKGHDLKDLVTHV